MTGGRAGLSCSRCASQALETCSVPLEIIFFFGSVTSTIHICLKKKKKDACSFQRAVTSPRVSSAALGLCRDGLDLKGKSA